MAAPAQESKDWLGLSGRVAVITGGGGGIGRATAVSFARAGAKVAVIDRDEKGLETGKRGDWQPLFQDIEGFEHVAGTRNVVRVKRYRIQDPPADAPSVAYVLDMVVESELVDPPRR